MKTSGSVTICPINECAEWILRVTCEGEQVARTAITVDPQMLATADDVVCGMSMKSTPISDTAVVNGKVYPFCSSGCKKAFMADMSKYKVN